MCYSFMHWTVTGVEKRMKWLIECLIICTWKENNTNLSEVSGVRVRNFKWIRIRFYKWIRVRIQVDPGSLLKSGSGFKWIRVRFWKVDPGSGWIRVRLWKWIRIRGGSGFSSGSGFGFTFRLLRERRFSLFLNARAKRFISLLQKQNELFLSVRTWMYGDGGHKETVYILLNI